MDANFKLKQKERGFKDPELSNGLAYMVADKRLQDHLSDCADKGIVEEVTPTFRARSRLTVSPQASTCGPNFHAVNQAYTKGCQGYAVTGVACVDCARHGFKRPNGTVDLQKGERYVYLPSLFRAVGSPQV